MDSLPIELIAIEVSRYLLPIDKQILRRINKIFREIFFYEQISFNKTKIELVHLIKYKKLWNQYTTINAARNGYLDCLKYAHENGRSWSKKTACAAAANGHLDCLKYAHENGCPWDEYTIYSATKNGHLDCLKYAHENGCLWDKKNY